MKLIDVLGVLGKYIFVQWLCVPVHVCSHGSSKSFLEVGRLEGCHNLENLFWHLQTVDVALFQLNSVGVYVGLQAATINGRSCYRHDGFNTTTHGVQTLKSYNVHSNV